MLLESSAESLTWADVIGEEKDKEYFKNLMKTILDEEKFYTIYPPRKDRFMAFKLTPFEKVKVVILGQDPYINPGQAHGLCFSVPKGVPLPPSLRNIYKEIESDIGCKMDYSNGDLTHWAKQGVLLLNSILTVRKGEPASHKHIGWEQFTDTVLYKLSLLKRNLVFILWGSFAWRKETVLKNIESHLILKANHPSPLSASKGFFGCKHFSKTNLYLTNHGFEGINWQNI